MYVLINNYVLRVVGRGFWAQRCVITSFDRCTAIGKQQRRNLSVSCCCMVSNITTHIHADALLQ